ncbi:hypothetical protein QUF63_17570, partial [Anaerolineales bacterium HSG25]|nr:hypothetical protein [Anaerolineales bacterium HSG25]
MAYVIFSDNPAQPSLTEDERQQQESKLLTIAADYAETENIEEASVQLQGLNIPNPDQYVAFMVDRYIQENRSVDDTELQNLFKLAQGVGST